MNHRGHRVYFVILFFIFNLSYKIFAEDAPTGISNISQGKNTVKITILYTNNTNGSLEPCGCPGNKYGGMAQRMTVIKQEREKDPNLLLLDAGDFFPTVPNPYHPEPVIKIMNLMRYDYVTIGDQEFINGVNYLKEKIPTMQFGVISANIVYKDTNERFIKDDYIIKEINGVKIAIIGLTSPDIFKFYPKERIENIDVLDPALISRKLAQKLHKETDMIIVLSHQGFDKSLNYAGAIYWVNIILSAHDNYLQDKPTRVVNEIPIFQAGMNVERIGKITIQYDTTEKKIALLDGDSIFVDKKIAKDPEIDKIIQDYQKNTPLYTDAMGINKKLGTNYCRKCHINQFNEWGKSKHAQALITIKKQRTVMHPNSC
ncbi:MAG: hypothetical protein HY934_06440, partial [Candidatus Firestonebacteria bacterium]|nr:hypothetical protein [Candidatus Firestonebacteria bacterium]